MIRAVILFAVVFLSPTFSDADEKASCPVELMKATRQAYNLDNARDELEKAKASIEIELHLEQGRTKKLQLEYDRIQAELNRTRQVEVDKSQR